MKKYRTFGVMIDLSRNGVMTVDSLKSYFAILSKMGYNMAMLYTEDVYEVEGEPYFGYLRGRYTKDELKELDAFACSVGIELVPCIQTLAHLSTFLCWGKVPTEDSDCMLADDERTYELVEKFIATCRECFRSNKIHLGMDEAGGIGRGKHLDIHGYEDPSAIIKRHLYKVNEIAVKYGYHNPMIWSDMFFRPWNDHKYEEYIGRKTVPQEILDSVPDNIELVYWAYSDDNRDVYDAMLYNHSQITDKLWFAGGIWGWIGRAPNNKWSIETMKRALDACDRYKIKDIMMTMWGNYGNECSRFAHLAALYYVVCYANGVTDEDKIKKGFKRITGADFDDFMALDLPNNPGSPEWGEHRNNPSYYMLYSDYFVGYLDYTVREGAADEYLEYAKTIREAGKRNRKYRYLFEPEAILCEILYNKYELGVKTRCAYQAGDKEKLLSLANNEYTNVEKLIPKLLAASREQWYRDHKPHGFDIIERRQGGLLARTASCKKRILDYVKGRIDAIPELEEQILPYGNSGESMLAVGHRTFSVSCPD